MVGQARHRAYTLANGPGSPARAGSSARSTRRRSTRGSPRSRALQRMREGDRAVDVPAAVDPVGRRDAHPHRHVRPARPRERRRRPRAASRMRLLERSRRKRRCAGSTAATGTGAAGSRAPRAARCRRSPGAPRAARRRAKSSRHRVDARSRPAPRARLTVGVRQRRRRHGLPAAGSAGATCAPPSHGTRLDALRPGMRQLDRHGIGAWRRIAFITRASAASFASLYSPRSAR